MESAGIHTRLKARLAIVRADLNEVVARFDDSLLAWAPREGMRTVAGQLEEIVATEVQLMTWVREARQITYKQAMAAASKATTLDAYRRLLETTRAETLATIDAYSEGELENPVPFPDKWFEALRMSPVPRSEAIRSLAQHEWYHTGQLVSYAWSRGDDPYDW